MGIVYRATHILLIRPVAVKLLTRAADDVTAKRFAREAKSAAAASTTRTSSGCSTSAPRVASTW